MKDLKVYIVEGPQPGTPAHHKELELLLTRIKSKGRKFTVLTNGVNRWTVIEEEEEVAPL